MKNLRLRIRGRAPGFGASLGSLLAAVVVACAGTDEKATGETAERDGGSPSTTTDGAVAEDAGDASSTDASTDAEDAAPKTCSDEGWCQTALPKQLILRGVWGDGQGAVWTVSEEGHVLRWDGAAWSIVFTTTMPLYAIWGSGPTDLWIGGAGGMLHGQGASGGTLMWTTLPLEVPIFSVAGTSANDVWATGYVSPSYSAFNGGRLFHYAGPTDDVNGGWVADPITSSQPARYEKVWTGSDSDVWVTGASSFSASSAIHRTVDTDGAATWIRVTPPAGGTFTRGGPIGNDDVALLGASPTESYYLGRKAGDGSIDWAWHDSFGLRKTGYASNAIWGFGLDDIYIAGGYGRFWHFDGTAWSVPQLATQNVIPVTATFNAIWASSPDDIWVVGQNIALHRSR